MTEEAPAGTTEAVPRRRPSIVRGSGIAASASVLSIGGGLLLDLTIAARYGANSATDTFWVAARLPIAVAAIVMVGGNQAMVPAISRWAAKRGQALADRFTTGLIAGSLVLGFALGLLLALLAEPLVRLTAPGLSRHEVAAAAPLLRVLAISIPLTISAEVFRALLNARFSVGAPAAMTAVRSVTAAAFIVAFGAGRGVSVIAWAFVAGAVAQSLFLAAMALKVGFRPDRGAGWRGPEVAAAGRLCVRPVTGASLNPLARIVEQVVVSFLPAGSITLLNYAYRLISAIGGSVFFSSVIVVIVPRLTEAIAHGRDRVARRMTRDGIMLMLAIAIPLTVFMAILAQPAMLGLFHRGRFRADSARLLGTMLVVYSFSLVGSGVQRALLAPFFSRLDTRTPLRNTIYGIVANLALLLVLVLPFRSDEDLAIVGVALAYSLAQYVNVAHAWFRLRATIPRPFAGTGGFTVRLLVASAVCGGVLLAGRLLFLDDLHGTVRLLVGVTLTAIVGGVVLLGVFGLIARRDIARLRGELVGAGKRSAASPS